MWREWIANFQHTNNTLSIHILKSTIRMSSIEAGKLFAVDGLVAIITGGGSGSLSSSGYPLPLLYRHSMLTIPVLGIGLMMAKALALNGAYKVYIIGRRKEVLEAAAKESPHGNIIPLVGDVTSKDSLHSITTHLEKEVGYVNVVIANSGILGPQTSSITPKSSLQEFQSILWNTSFEDYTQTFAVNTSAVYYTIVAFLGLLDAGNKKGNVEQRSQVIATSSIAGFNRNTPGGYAYGQSKAATTLLIKQLATSLVPYSIRANVLAPGRRPSILYILPFLNINTCTLFNPYFLPPNFSTKSHSTTRI